MTHLSLQEEKALAEFKKRVRKALGDQVVSFTLFGSRARGEGHEESDLDILALLQERTSERRREIIHIASDIFLEYEIDISPLVLGQTEFQNLKDRELLIAQEIERDGIQL